jgi:hypothetical protein
MAERNLTAEAMLNWLRMRKDQELSLIPISATVIETVVKNPGSKSPEYVDRRVSQREFEARVHDARIAQHCAEFGLSLN